MKQKRSQQKKSRNLPSQKSSSARISSSLETSKYRYSLNNLFYNLLVIYIWLLFSSWIVSNPLTLTWPTHEMFFLEETESFIQILKKWRKLYEQYNFTKRTRTRRKKINQGILPNSQTSQGEISPNTLVTNILKLLLDHRPQSHWETNKRHQVGAFLGFFSQRSWHIFSAKYTKYWLQGPNAIKPSFWGGKEGSQTKHQNSPKSNLKKHRFEGKNQTPLPHLVRKREMNYQLRCILTH